MTHLEQTLLKEVNCLYWFTFRAIKDAMEKMELVDEKDTP